MTTKTRSEHESGAGKLILWLVILALAGLAVIWFTGQLGLHPQFTHPDDIDTVRNAFDFDPRCQKNSKHYQLYRSDAQKKLLETCELKDNLFAIRIWAETEPVKYEITGFPGTLRYVLHLIARDGYILLAK